MDRFTRRYSFLTATLSLLTIANGQTVAVPDGYAEGTTGGGNAAPITVSSTSAFRSAVGNNSPAVIVVDGRLNVGDVSIGSNKTVIGKETTSGLYGGCVRVRGNNYIFQNLTIGPSSTDAMEISGATKVFDRKDRQEINVAGIGNPFRVLYHVTISVNH